MKRQRTKAELIKELKNEKEALLLITGQKMQKIIDLMVLKEGYEWDAEAVKEFDGMTEKFVNAFNKKEIEMQDLWAFIDELKADGIDIMAPGEIKL